jgi:hypothetical protein
MFKKYMIFLINLYDDDEDLLFKEIYLKNSYF